VAIRSKSQSNKNGCNVYSELENGVANLSRGWKSIDDDDDDDDDDNWVGEECQLEQHGWAS